jgi:iron complex outermembrane recepter protein
MQQLWRAALLVVAFAAALPAAARAQATIRGVVVDQTTKSPVAGALVRATGTTIATTTSDSGTFILSSARPIARVTISRVGYTAKEVDVSGGDLRVELAPTSTELPGVQVIARNPAPSTAVLTRGDIDRFDGVNLVNEINTIPGIFMQSRTPFGGSHITIRGYYPSFGGNSPNSNSSGSTVFLNNVPVTDASGITILDDIDYSSLGSIEVIKGPASSLYGAAIGGTLNMHFVRPTPGPTRFSQQVLGGGNGLLRTNSSVSGANGVSDFAINYGHQGDDSFRPHSVSRKEYLRADGDLAVGSSQAVSGFFTYNRSNEQLAGEIDSTDFYARRAIDNPAYVANDAHTNITSFMMGSTDNFHISNQFSNQTAVFGSGRFADSPFAHGFTDVTQFNWGARSSFGYTGRLGGVDLAGRLGGMAQRSNVTSNGVFITPAPPFPERPSASQNYAVNAYLFTEWNFSLPAGVTLTAGGDLIHNSFTVQNLLKSNQLSDTTAILTRSFGSVFAPRAQVQKAFGGVGSVYASVGEGFTPPLLTNIVANNGTINTQLKPERAVQYEVGAQGSLFQSRLNGQIDWFDLDNRDKLTSQTVATVTSTINVGEQRNTGVEASLAYSVLSDPTAAVTLLRPWLSYTYTHAEYVNFKSDANNTPTTVDFSGNQVARVPQNMMSAGIDAVSKAGFYLYGTYQFVGRVPVTFDNSTWVRSYSLLGGKLGYRTQLMHRYSLDVAAGGDNLTNSTYYTFLFVGPNIRGLAQAPDGGTGDGYILPGMYNARYYVSASVSLPFK